MDDDTEQAAWGEQELQGRRRQEDEALERHRATLKQFREDNAVFEAQMTEFFYRRWSTL